MAVDTRRPASRPTTFSDMHVLFAFLGNPSSRLLPSFFHPNLEHCAPLGSETNGLLPELSTRKKDT